MRHSHILLKVFSVHCTFKVDHNEGAVLAVDGFPGITRIRELLGQVGEGELVSEDFRL